MQEATIVPTRRLQIYCCHACLQNAHARSFRAALINSKSIWDSGCLSRLRCARIDYDDLVRISLRRLIRVLLRPGSHAPLIAWTGTKTVASARHAALDTQCHAIVGSCTTSAALRTVIGTSMLASEHELCAASWARRERAGDAASVSDLSESRHTQDCRS